VIHLGHHHDTLRARAEARDSVYARVEDPTTLQLHQLIGSELTEDEEDEEDPEADEPTDPLDELDGEQEEDIQTIRDWIRGLSLEDAAAESEEARDRIKMMLAMHSDLFVGIGSCDEVEHQIQLKDPEQRPYCAPFRRRSEHEMIIERRAVRKLIKAGVLEPSSSPWAFF